MRLFRTSFLLLICFCMLAADAQGKKTDSLENVLKNPARDTNRAKALYTLANYYTATDPARAIELADEAIALGKELSYPRAISGGVLCKGPALITLGKTDDAIKLYNEYLPVLLNLNYTSGYCAIQARLGYVELNRGRPSDAILKFREASADAEKYKHFDSKSDAQRGMGMAYNSVGDHEKAASCFIEAINAAKLAGNPTQVGYAYITLGNSQTNQKDYDAALRSYRQALVILDSTRNDYGRAGCYICIGNIFLFQEQLDSSLANYQKCLDIRERMNNDPSAVASVKENIAGVLLKQGKPEPALVYFKEGLAVFEAQSYQEGIAGSYSNMGNAYAMLQQYDEAEASFLAAIRVARPIKANHWIKDSYEGLSKLYYTTGRYKESADYKDSLIAITDVIVGEQHAAQSKEIEARFQNQQKEEQIKYLTDLGVQREEINAKQQQIIVAVSIGLFLVVVLMIFVARINGQRKKANAQLSAQNLIIAEKNKDITDSINYAQRIQQSVLPDQQLLFGNVADAFIHYRPRDIVSGDFYWFRKEGKRLYVAAADCTGHGVPGALVSVVGVNILEQILSADKSPATGTVLDRLHRMMYAALHKESSGGASDGMDIALICIDSSTMTVEFSGAGRPLLHWNGEQLRQVKGDRFSIGGVKDVNDTSTFTTQEIPLKPGDAFYLFTDGYADQFGGPEGKKFMSKNFVELIAAHAAMGMPAQQSKIDSAFRNWQGSQSQVDDVLVIGVRA